MNREKAEVIVDYQISRDLKDMIYFQKGTPPSLLLSYLLRGFQVEKETYKESFSYDSIRLGNEGKVGEYCNNILLDQEGEGRGYGISNSPGDGKGGSHRLTYSDNTLQEFSEVFSQISTSFQLLNQSFQIASLQMQNLYEIFFR